MVEEIWRSSLNPNAPMFVPGAYREVEDFSEQWWELVHSTAWFRDYWLQECFLDPQIPSNDDFLEEHMNEYDYEEKEEEEEEWCYRDGWVSLGVSKRGGWGRAMAEIPKYSQKAPKIVSVKVRPRPIQQPR